MCVDLWLVVLSEHRKAVHKALVADCDIGDADMAAELIKKGADVDFVVSEKFYCNTPLAAACWKGHMNVVRLLLDAGADIDRVDARGIRPFLLACLCGHIDVIRLLMAAGADIHRTGALGSSALYWACIWKPDAGIVILLVESGTDINQTNDGGWTSLHAASSKGHIAVISILIIEGAGVSLRDNSGETAQDKAAYYGNIDKYDYALTPRVLAAAKLRFGRSLLEETIIPAMAVVDSCYEELNTNNINISLAV